MGVQGSYVDIHGMVALDMGTANQDRGLRYGGNSEYYF